MPGKRDEDFFVFDIQMKDFHHLHCEGTVEDPFYVNEDAMLSTPNLYHEDSNDSSGSVRTGGSSFPPPNSEDEYEEEEEEGTLSPHSTSSTMSMAMDMDDLETLVIDIQEKLRTSVGPQELTAPCSSFNGTPNPRRLSSRWRTGGNEASTPTSNSGPNTKCRLRQLQSSSISKKKWKRCSSLCDLSSASSSKGSGNASSLMKGRKTRYKKDTAFKLLQKLLESGTLIQEAVNRLNINGSSGLGENVDSNSSSRSRSHDANSGSSGAFHSTFFPRAYCVEGDN